MFPDTVFTCRDPLERTSGKGVPPSKGTEERWRTPNTMKELLRVIQGDLLDKLRDTKWQVRSRRDTLVVCDQRRSVGRTVEGIFENISGCFPPSWLSLSWSVTGFGTEGRVKYLNSPSLSYHLIIITVLTVKCCSSEKREGYILSHPLWGRVSIHLPSWSSYPRGTFFHSNHKVKDRPMNSSIFDVWVEMRRYF